MRLTILVRCPGVNAVGGLDVKTKFRSKSTTKASVGAVNRDRHSAVIPRMYGPIETAPLINTDAVSDSLGSHCKHCWVVTDENDAASWRKSCLNNTNNVGNGQAREQWPHGKVLESSW